MSNASDKRSVNKKEVNTTGIHLQNYLQVNTLINTMLTNQNV